MVAHCVAFHVRNPWPNRMVRSSRWELYWLLGKLRPFDPYILVLWLYLIPHLLKISRWFPRWRCHFSVSIIESLIIIRFKHLRQMCALRILCLIRWTMSPILLFRWPNFCVIRFLPKILSLLHSHLVRS